jgi:hypothetical protein
MINVHLLRFTKNMWAIMEGYPFILNERINQVTELNETIIMQNIKVQGIIRRWYIKIQSPIAREEELHILLNVDIVMHILPMSIIKRLMIGLPSRPHRSKLMYIIMDPRHKIRLKGLHMHGMRGGPICMRIIFISKQISKKLLTKNKNVNDP